MSEEFDFESIKNKALEQLKSGKPLLGKDGAFAPLLESILNAALEGEMDAHLSEDERMSGNRRNGKMQKQVQTSMGEVTVSTPRDRNSTFEPQFIKKRETILAEGVADRIIGLLEANEVKKTELIVNRLRMDMVKRGDMMSVEDVCDILAIPLLGAVPDDEHIVIATIQGEPLVGTDCLAGQAYSNICKRILGETVEFLNLEEKQVTVAVMAIYLVSTFVGGFMIGKWNRVQKFLWGMIVGAGYFILLLLVSFGIYHSLKNSGGNVITTMFLCIGGGLLGGMLA